MFRRVFLPAVVVLALVVSAATALPAAAKTNSALATHKLIVAVKRNMPPAAEKKLAVLVMIRQKAVPPAGALATPDKPLVVIQDNRRVYRVKVEIDSSCTGTCSAKTYRISGAARHKLEVIPSCQLESSGFVCSKVKVVKIY
jgi:hypothetical protein